MTRRKIPPHRIRLLVLLQMNALSAYELLTGVMRTTATFGNCDVQFADGTDAAKLGATFCEWHPDGLIADGVTNGYPDDLFARLAGRAVVYVCTPPRAGGGVPCATLDADNRALAIAATRLLTGKKLRHYAVVGFPHTTTWSEERRRHFLSAIRRTGASVSAFDWPKAENWTLRMNALADWIKRLPKPCGIWAVNDSVAKSILDLCAEANIAVPDQIKLLGTDNVPFICEHVRPSLSSLVPDVEEGGALAAKFLLQAVDHPPRTPRRLLFGLKGIVERQSTADVNGSARRVVEAMEFIRLHATSNLRVTDIARALHVSERLLRKNYRAVTGRTLIGDLVTERLARIKELLRNTETPIGEIGPLCGFSSFSNLKALFRRREGLTMTAYRQQSR